MQTQSAHAGKYNYKDFCQVLECLQNIILLLLEFAVSQLANVHFFSLPFFLLFSFHAVLSRHLPLNTYLWGSFLFRCMTSPHLFFFLPAQAR